MNSHEYWKKRIDNIYDSNYHKQKLKKIYQTAYKENEKKIIELWDELQKKGSLTTTQLYQFERFISLKKSLEKQTGTIQNMLKQRMLKDLSNAYKQTFKATSKLIGTSFQWTIENDKMLNKVLNKKWCGNNFSKRIWTNSNNLSKDIESSIVDCITRGTNKEVYIKMLKEKYNVGFHNADRLVRTELMHTINESQRDVYKSEGITKVKWYAAEDERMCDICGDMHNKEYDIDDVPSIGHANCRCTYIPIIEKE